MTNLRLFTLVAPLILLGSLAWGWGHFAYSEATPRAQAADPQAEVIAETPASEARDSQRGRSAFRAGITDADYTLHVNQLKARIKRKVSSNQFSIVIQKPFVVIGDERQPDVQRHAETTIKGGRHI